MVYSLAQSEVDYLLRWSTQISAKQLHPVSIRVVITNTVSNIVSNTVANTPLLYKWAHANKVYSTTSHQHAVRLVEKLPYLQCILKHSMSL